MHVSRGTLQRIVSGTAGISPDMAYRLAAITGTSAEMWARMQMEYDLWQAKFVKRPALKRMLARFDPAIHGGEFMPGAPIGKEAFAKGSKRSR
jgi:plasmid maintenance system antidote protein VapI